MAKKQTDQSVLTSTDQVQNLEQPSVSLSLQDLVLVAQIIQLTTQRGAFRAEELAQIGGVYNKLIAFLESSGAVSRQAPTGASEENLNA